MVSTSFYPAWCTLSVMAALFMGSVQAATFKDDRGTTHTWDSSTKAKVAVRAGIGGVTLFHMGMTSEQLVATWGIWGIRGSDFDPENPEAGSVFPEMDPGADEAAFLASAINLSPSCYTNPRGCFQVDNVTDLIAIEDQIDFVLFVDNAADEKFLEIDAAGFPVIFVDTFYDYNENCRAQNYSLIDPSQCFGRSMIDIAVRMEELAIFLGVSVDAGALNAQKQAACEAASTFTEAMEEAHEKGLRVKAIWLGVEQDAETGMSYADIMDLDPIEMWLPRTMEELGMPLLHADTYNESWVSQPSEVYFKDCEPGVYNQECNGDTYFPVDFWLIDSRSSRLVDDNFKLIFPDRAILADQWWYMPINDGPLSYKIIASYLSEMTARISAAEKVQESTGTCTAVDPKSSAHLAADGSGGLPLNAFVCYDRDLIQEEYLKCPEVSGTAPTPSATSGAVLTTEEASSDDTAVPTTGSGEASSDDTDMPATGSGEAPSESGAPPTSSAAVLGGHLLVITIVSAITLIVV